MILDSIRVWHVSKAGNDNNSGHAAQYPVNLANDSKLTISAAVTAASSGDIIIIHPGTYDESIDLDTAVKSLEIIGTNRENCIISPTSGTKAVILTTGCSLKNLTVISNTINNNYAVYFNNKSNILIDNCHIKGSPVITGGSSVGIEIYGTTCIDIIINNSFVESASIALQARQVTGLRAINCCFYSSPGIDTDTSRAVALEPSISTNSNLSVFDNCTMYVDRSNASTGFFAIAVDAGVNSIFNNCSIYCKTTGSCPEKAIGVQAGYIQTKYTYPVLNNCSIFTSSVLNSAYDLYTDNANCRIVLCNCNFDKTKVSGSGTVKEYLRPATFGYDLALDSSGRIDVGKLSGDGQSVIDLKDLVDTGYDPSTHRIDSRTKATDDINLSTKQQGDVKTQAASALTDYGANKIAPATPADVTAVGDKVDALNDISAEEVNAQCDTAISDAALATADGVTAVGDAVALLNNLSNDDIANALAAAGLATAENLAAAKTVIDLLKNIAEADEYIDITKTPWQLVKYKKGDIATEYIRKNIKDVNGANITGTTTVIGQLKEPT